MGVYIVAHEKTCFKLLSWNVCDVSTDSTRVLECIEDTKPDLLILQEASLKHIEALRTIFTNVVAGERCVQGRTKSYIVIASNLVVNNASVISHSDRPMSRPSFLAKMSRNHQFFESLSLEILTLSGSSLQLAAIHTSAYANPTVRAKEVASVVSNLLPNGPCLIAGDFNHLALPAISWLGTPFLGFGASDLAVQEAQHLSAALEEEGFSKLDLGIIDHRFQLRENYVFVRSIKVHEANALAKAWGADHRPVFVSFEIVE